MSSSNYQDYNNIPSDTTKPYSPEMPTNHYPTTTNPTNPPTDPYMGPTTTQGRIGGTGSRFGDYIKGAWNVIHGAGEVFRGTVNSALDNVGDTVAGRPGQPVTTRSTADVNAAQTHGGVTQSGYDEIQRGMNQFRR
ncbi:hypothetical protein FRC02_012147 [Tulasnella sp. 418]|nr:hypothetical protein FRC02_012147 [Tulasnella sp. 418]